MAEQAKWWHKPMLLRLGLKRLIISFAFCEQLIPTILFFLLSWKVHVSLTVVQSLRHFHGSEGRLLLLSAWRPGGWGCGSGVVLVTLCPLFRAVWLVVAGSLALCCLIRCPVCRQQCFGIKIKNLYWYTSGLRSDDASKVCVHLVEYEPTPLGLCTPGWIWTHSPGFVYAWLWFLDMYMNPLLCLSACLFFVTCSQPSLSRIWAQKIFLFYIIVMVGREKPSAKGWMWNVAWESSPLHTSRCHKTPYLSPSLSTTLPSSISVQQGIID